MVSQDYLFIVLFILGSLFLMHAGGGQMWKH